MKNSPANHTQHQPLHFDPVDGLEAREVGYVEWLLAGGAPAPEYLQRAWAETEPGGLTT